MNDDYTSNQDYVGGLIPLSELDDVTVAEGYTDIRGFDAFTEQGHRIGEVNELLADRDESRVAAITIGVDHDLLDAGGEPRVQVPIENVEIDTAGRRVTVLAAGVSHLGISPRTTAAWEADRRENTGTTARGPGAATGQAEERVMLSEEELDIGRRQVDAGAVEITKRVETEHVREPVTLRHDEVTVERRPVTDQSLAANARFESDEIRVPIMEEEIVVEKRVVPKEELVIRKSEVAETKMVGADVRHEEVDVQRSGDVRGSTGADQKVDVDNPLRGGRDIDGVGRA
jgi:uncharacterized protein (TIGR02271 family)